MTRIHTVAKARKGQGRCGNCHMEIRRGDAYLWWQFRGWNSAERSRYKFKRCDEPACRPKISELTQSKFKAGILGVKERLDAVLTVDLVSGDSSEVIAREYNRAAHSISLLGKEAEDKREAIAKHFPAGSPTIELLKHRSAWCDSIVPRLYKAELHHRSCARGTTGRSVPDIDWGGEQL